jgi:hypothetical protein
VQGRFNWTSLTPSHPSTGAELVRGTWHPGLWLLRLRGMASDVATYVLDAYEVRV